MNSSCLSCHKEINQEGFYHPKCLDQLFGVSWIPKIPFLISDLPAKGDLVVIAARNVFCTKSSAVAGSLTRDWAKR